MKTCKQVILDIVSNLAADSMYYDRKEDEELPVGSIEEAIKNGIITKQEIVDHFIKEWGVYERF